MFTWWWWSNLDLPLNKQKMYLFLSSLFVEVVVKFVSFRKLELRDFTILPTKLNPIKLRAKISQSVRRVDWSWSKIDGFEIRRTEIWNHLELISSLVGKRFKTIEKN